MKGGENLYYFDKQEIKLVDISHMNKLIQSYPQIREAIAALGTLSFDDKLSQK
jgi:hypothetical protein